MSGEKPQQEAKPGEIGTAADGKEYKLYKANCHCGRIRFTCPTTPPLEDGYEVVSCNCSICHRNGGWHIYVPRERLTFVDGYGIEKVQGRKLDRDVEDDESLGEADALSRTTTTSP